MALTDTQSILLAAAAQRDDRLLAVGDRLHGTASQKVASSLLASGFAEEVSVSRQQPWWWEKDHGLVGLRATRQGLTAIGIDEPGEEDLAAVAGHKHIFQTPIASKDPVGCNRKSLRAGSKQDQLIAMLSRDGGVSIAEIATALGWLPHTTRAALTGLRHKGYELSREIGSDRGSLYRITAMPITASAATDAVQGEAA